MITNITLENFKCFRQVSINPKRLTVLIGPNGTGKSSVLQALLLLKQSVGEETLQVLQGRLFSFSSSAEVSPKFFISMAKYHHQNYWRNQRPQITLGRRIQKRELGFFWIPSSIQTSRAALFAEEKLMPKSLVLGWKYQSHRKKPAGG